MKNTSPSNIRKIHNRTKTAVVDNRHFQFRSTDDSISQEYAFKWIHAFLNTRDPMNWLLNRQQSSRRLRTITQNT